MLNGVRSYQAPHRAFSIASPGAGKGRQAELLSRAAYAAPGLPMPRPDLSMAPRRRLKAWSRGQVEIASA